MRVRELVIGVAAGASAVYVCLRGKDSGPALTEVREALLELEDIQVGDRDSLARQVESLLRGQEEMLEFVRSVLDDEALSGGIGMAHRRRVVSVSVRVGEADQDVMRGLVGSFCDGVGMEVILQAEGGVGGRGPYLVWRPSDGRPLENVLAAVLAAVPWDFCDQGGEHAPDIPGLDELRRLLLALHERGPGTIRIGPLILSRTPQALLGRVMSPRELAGLSPWDGHVPSSDAGIDLAPWADGYRFFAA
jgi:hypothetical protein